MAEKEFLHCRHEKITSVFEENLGRASAAQGVLEWLKRSFCIAGFFRNLLKNSPDLLAYPAVNDQRTIRIHQ
jgi:hypothetical protein